MFKIELTVSMLFLSLLGAFMAIKLPKISESDYRLYHTLLQSSDPEAQERNISISKQQRQKVRKDLWFQGNEPLYFCILSEASELSFFHEGDHLEVVEELDLVSCMMQEELVYRLRDGREVVKKEDGRLFIKNGAPDNPLDWIDPNTEDLTPMQYVRYLEAAKGHYNYNTQLFTAKDVKLWKYCVEGHTLPSSFETVDSLMSATAEDITFAIKGKKIDFHANLMKATFEPNKGSL